MSDQQPMQKISLTYYSDVLCIWAHIAQIRIDEVAKKYPREVQIRHRFCSIFGDTLYKISQGWKDRGGYAGFSEHLQQAVKPYPHVSVNPDVWKTCRPASSTPAHLVLKAAQSVDDAKCETLLKNIRLAFFEECRDVARWTVLQEIVESAGLPFDAVQSAIHSGTAFAELEADHREQQELKIQGSPTFILDNGRQKLYGNVGYGVIEANIRELLRAPDSGSASWC